jgi:hypothetical protein
MAEGLGEVALADARRSDEQDVLALGDEGARGEVDDLRLRDARVEVEVEVLEGLRVLEVGAAKPEVELLGLAALDLVVQQPVQKLGEAEVVVDGLRGSAARGCEARRSARAS